MSDRSGIAADYRIAIADEIRDIERMLGRGNAKSYKDYLAMCAEISALKTSLNTFESILEKYLDESETDELEDV